MWLPLKTGGTGHATGLEWFLRGRLTSRMSAVVSVTYSRALYKAADGILRPGNFDFPLIANAMLTFQLPRAYTLSVRNSFTTGRPYTPYNIPLSLEQDRGIYDLSQVNERRGPSYDRMDISVDHNFYMGLGVLNLYVGLQNIFNRKNFLGYVWLPRCLQYSKCVASTGGLPIKEVDQMPAFPIAGLRWDSEKSHTCTCCIPPDLMRWFLEGCASLPASMFQSVVTQRDWKPLNDGAALCLAGWRGSSASLGKRSNSALNAIWASARASGAPRQKCTPPPNE